MNNQNLYDQKNLSIKLVNNSVWYAWIFGLMFLIFAVIGSIRNYTPVPYWDMWNGVLYFFDHVSHGEYGAWWWKHNEHRIVFSRLLFWIDMELFHGRQWFLIASNYLLAGLIWMLMRLIANWILSEERSTKILQIYSGLSLALLFSWIQKDNFTAGFQSQMFAVLLFALLSFYLFARAQSTGGKDSTRLFALSLIIGLMSIGTMINGLLVLPVLTLMAISMRAQRTRISVLLALSFVAILLYFLPVDPTNNDSHQSALLTLREQPVEVFKMLLAHLGSPAAYMFDLNGAVAITVGAILLFCFAWCVLISLRSKIRNPALDVLLAIAMFTILTGFAMACGRVGLYDWSLGLSSRYMTNALLLWTAMMLIMLHKSSRIGSMRTLTIIIVMLVPFGLFAQQVRALLSVDDKLADLWAGALAIELGIRDDEIIRLVYPYPEVIFQYAKESKAYHRSVFGDPMLRDAAQSLGTSVLDHGKTCQGAIDTIKEISGKPGFLRSGLWVIDPKTGLAPDAFYVLNPQRKVIGYGVSGYDRYDENKTRIIDKGGAIAYMLASEVEPQVILKGRYSDCEVVLTVPTKIGNRMTSFKKY